MLAPAALARILRDGTARRGAEPARIRRALESGAAANWCTPRPHTGVHNGAGLRTLARFANRRTMFHPHPPSLFERLFRRRQGRRRRPEPADLGTAFGLEQTLDQPDWLDYGAKRRYPWLSPAQGMPEKPR